LDGAGEDLKILLREESVPVSHVISGVTGEGVTPLLRDLRKAIAEARLAEQPVEEAGPWRP
jgi:hypothetical protein